MSKRRPKPRGDSPLQSLPEAVQQQVFTLLLENTYKIARPKVEKLTGLRTSESALCRFYGWYRGMRDDIERAKMLADTMAEKIAQTGIALDDDTIGRVAQLGFELRALEDRDYKAHIQLRRLRQKERELAADERRVRVMEEKHAAVKRQLEAAIGKAKSKGGLTAETLREIEEAAAIL